MKYITVLAASFIFSIYTLSAKAADQPKPAVLITGDSWATLPCLFESIDDAFFNRHLDVEIPDCLSTTQIGSRADDFNTYSAYRATMNTLASNPNIKVVYMSLGGNDMFKFWQKTMSPKQESDLFVYIREHVQKFVDEIHKVKPNVWVLVSGYDNGYLYDHNPFSGYRKIFEHMGKPTALEVHDGFLRFAQEMAKLRGDHVEYQHHIGLMHYYYGVPEDGLPARQTLAPRFISSPTEPGRGGGRPNSRNNKWAMAHIFSYFFDPHHLRPRGFMKLFEHAIDGYIGHWLKGDQFDAEAAANEEDIMSGEVSADVENKALDLVQKQFEGRP